MQTESHRVRLVPELSGAGSYGGYMVYPCRACVAGG
jgi:hypothetical protein